VSGALVNVMSRPIPFGRPGPTPAAAGTGVKLPPPGSTLSPASGIQAIAFGVAVFLVLVVFSRVVEYPGFQLLHLAMVAFALALLMLPFGGGWGRALKDPLFLGVGALTFLMLLAVPLSIWRGGSVGVLQTYWMRTLIVLTTVAVCVFTFAQYRKLMMAFSLAILALSLYTLLKGSEEQGRIGLESGFFSNPNDLAAILAMGLPLILASIRLLRPVVLKGAILASTAILGITFLRTGSRGGFIAMVVVVTMLFLHASMMRRLQMLVAGMVLAVAAVAYLPSATLKRFVVFSESVRLAEFEEGEDDAYTESSYQSRMEMARQGVIFTLKNPVFGLGPGNFRIASTDLFKAQGQRTPWTDVHNTYLQISSENGIPALIVYISLLVIAFRRLGRFYRLYRNADYLENRWIADAAWYLRLALLSYIFSAAFGNYAYQYHLPVLLGLTIALTTAEGNRPDAVRAPELVKRRARLARSMSPLAQPAAPPVR
jgi:O-antigen ligase